MQAILFDGIKTATVSFHPSKLPRLQEKYGSALRVLGSAVPLQPAAPSLATVAYFAPDRPALPKPKPVEKAVKAKPSPKVITSPKPKPAKLPKLKAPKAEPHAAKCKPVINLTTGVFYPSVKLAAEACGGNFYCISRLLSKKNKIRNRHRGQSFRWATEDEIKAKQMLHS